MDKGRIIALTGLVILIMQSIVIFSGNGYIIAVHGYQWLQSRKIAPCDFLLVSLSASRSILHLIVMTSQIYYYSHAGYDFNKMEIFSIIWMFFVIMNLSCLTWLNVFYCVKIANCFHPLMLWLKRRINVLAPRLLGGSVGLYLVIYLSIMNTYIKNRMYCSWTETFVRNASQSKFCSGPLQFFYPVFFCFAFINFSLCITVSVILLTSLKSHINNLKNRGTDINDMSTQAHTSVLKHLLFFLFSYILYFSFLTLSVSNIRQFHSENIVLVDLVLSCYPLVHTIVVITSNPKLRKVCSKILKIKK